MTLSNSFTSFITTLALVCAVVLIPAYFIGQARTPHELQYSGRGLVYLVDGPGNGSGVKINAYSILTVHHVASHMGENFQTGGAHGCFMTWSNEKEDFAIITCESEIEGEAAPIKCAPVKRGDHLVAFGAPYGHPNLLAEVTVAGFGEDEVIVAGMMLPGMSGGPIVDARGYVVGLSHAVWSFHDGDMSLPTTMGFMIPITKFCELTGRR